MSRFRMAMTRFMAGRRGLDQLSAALYALGLLLYILAIITGSSVLQILYLACLGYGLFRGLSRNIAARERENRWFLGKSLPLLTKFRQARVRFKNRRVYLYYRCPQCKSWLKLPRNVGEKHVTCGHCGASFDKKA